MSCSVNATNQCLVLFHCHTHVVAEKDSIGLNSRRCNFTHRIIMRMTETLGKSVILEQ